MKIIPRWVKHKTSRNKARWPLQQMTLQDDYRSYILHKKTSMMLYFQSSKNSKNYNVINYQHEIYVE